MTRLTKHTSGQNTSTKQLPRQFAMAKSAVINRFFGRASSPRQCHSQFYIYIYQYLLHLVAVFFAMFVHAPPMDGFHSQKSAIELILNKYITLCHSRI